MKSASATRTRKARQATRSSNRKRSRVAPPPPPATSPRAAIVRPLVAPPQEEFDLAAARAGDHHHIHGLLQRVLHRPSAAEFQSETEDPFYEPSDRIIVKHHDQVIAHTHLIKRELRFGELTLPASIVSDFVVAPEFRGRGCGSLILDELEQRLQTDGTRLAILKTRTPQYFLKRGWTVCLRHSYSQAGAREILSYLRASESRTADPLQANQSPLNVRIWRHVEQSALLRLYDENADQRFGDVVRTDAFWHWLISRRSYDRIYVAINGPDRLELGGESNGIVGYAVMKSGRILELQASEAFPQAGQELLSRACRDAIEHDLNQVRFDAPPDHALHKVLEAAGGQRNYHESDCGEVFLVKLQDPWKLFRSLRTTFYSRARAAGLNVPCELGLQVGDVRTAISIGRRGAKLIPDKLGRSYLTCSAPVLQQLLLGHLELPHAIESGRVRASTHVASELGSALFPQLPIWRPPWDELPG